MSQEIKPGNAVKFTEESGRVEYGQFVLTEGLRALVDVIRECDDRPGTFRELNWIEAKRLIVIPKLPF